MHEDGEVDIRGVYCALSVASITNIKTEAMFENTTQWVIRSEQWIRISRRHDCMS